MDSVSLFSEATRQRIADLTHYFLTHGIADPMVAQHQAIIAIGKIIRRQAFVMSYSDVFLLLGIGLVLALLAALALKKAAGGSAAGAH
jgi:MFS transporter, DHA2 family, multidrug resistance protein